MNNTTGNADTRGLAAALSGPAFLPRAMSQSIAGAERHANRWAPEASSALPRSLRSVAFADRLLAPLFSVASQLGGARMFSNYQADGFRERQVASGGWLFPKPWYQDELRWLAAAKMQQSTANSMFTTRGTFAPRNAAVGGVEQQVPLELYPYVAPSFVGSNDGLASYGSSAIDAWSPSVSATSASVARMAAAIGTGSMQSGAAGIAGRSPQMSVLAATVRAALLNAAPNVAANVTAVTTQSRLAMLAPDMVTPPAPRRAPALSNNVVEASGGNVANLEYREQLAAQRIAVQQRIVAMAAQAQQAQAEQAAAQSAREAQAAAVAWDSVQTPSVANERQGHAKSLARQHVELVARAAEIAQSRVAQAAQRNRVEQSEAAQQLTAQQAAQATTQSAELLAAQQATASRVQSQAPAQPAAQRTGSNPSAGTAQQPTIAQLTQLVEQLRFAELLAANPGLTSFTPASGPRMLMPAGLGGLAASVATAQRVGVSQPNYVASRTAQTAPSMAALDVGARSEGALASIERSAPRALAHVAWSDRWLGRFAGAAPTQLASFAAASTMRSEQAPSVIYVAPRMNPILANGQGPGALAGPGLVLDRRPVVQPVVQNVDLQNRVGTAELAPTMAVTAAEGAHGRVAEAVRYDDDAQTPDDVFAAIASSVAASRTRGRDAERARAVASNAETPSSLPTNANVANTVSNASDGTFTGSSHAIAMNAPSIAGAGFSAGLAGSPFAPGLRDAGIVGPDVEAASFDVRAMFTAALVEAFFRGEYGNVGATTQEPTNDVGVFARTVQDFAPTWLAPATRIRTVPVADTEGLGTSTSGAMPIAAPRSAPAVSTHTTAAGSALATDPVYGGERAERTAAAPVATRIVSLSDADIGSDAYEVVELAVPAAFAASAVPARGDFGGAVPTRYESSVDNRVDYRLGAIGRSASAWSVSQQNASTDLMLDFLPPELVVAAQAYGLSPQAALVAARLSAAGPAAIAGLASQVDLAFLQAPARTATMHRLTAHSADSNFGAFDNVVEFGGASPASVPSSSAAESVTAQNRWESLDGLAMANHTLSEIAPVRQPRGAFLWPQAATAALGIKGENLASSDGQSQFTVAALEVLAAKAVADLGAYAPLAGNDVKASNQSAAQDGQAIPFVDASRRPELLRGVLRANAGTTAGAANLDPWTASLDGSTAAGAATNGPTETTVFERVAAQLPMMQQQQFRALFLRSVGSPSVRAAQALALVHRSGVLADNASLAERASLAWDAMPMLALQKQLSDAGPNTGFELRGLEALAASMGDATNSFVGASAIAGNANAPRLASALQALQTMLMPAGLPTQPQAPLSNARSVGDSLASLVSPSRSDVSSNNNASSSTAGALKRPPTASPEMVRAGARRSNEAEIPEWFEKAARKMFGEPTGTAADGISLADLTLINSAPPQQIAASTRGETVALSAAPSVASGSNAEPGEKFDVERIARDVYRAVLQIMEAARARNGEPYL